MAIQKILLVDDNRLNRRVAAEILTRHGCEVSEATDGESGVALARENPYDLILMDAFLRPSSSTDATGVPLPDADISVAVSTPTGLITPIIRDAGRKGLAEISTEMKALAGKAKDGKLQPHEFQGGTSSLSNLGMFGTKQFDAVINPPQAMILAVGAGEQRPWVEDGQIVAATVMSATGSFDHRAIDGADGAQLMEALKSLVENPMGLVV